MSPDTHVRYGSKIALQEDLCRLARFGANISDAFSCFIFLPKSILTLFDENESLNLSDQNHSIQNDLLIVAGYHSLSTDVIQNAILSPGTGLIGWVAKHKRAIHVSPFEHDSRTLGVYARDEGLKSFIGIPIHCTLQSNKSSLFGVVACDSKKSYAFSKLQGKLLEDLAMEISNTIELSQACRYRVCNSLTWEMFTTRGYQLVEALGSNSIEMLRIRCSNFQELERRLGMRRTIELIDQVNRLIQQALPPHFPLYRLPSGETLILIDNMMTSLYLNKMNAICRHVTIEDQQLILEYTTDSSAQSFAPSSNRKSKVHQHKQEIQTSFIALKEPEYEYRRA